MSTYQVFHQSQALYTVTCPPARYPTNHKRCIQSHVNLPGTPPITSIVYSHMSTYQVFHQSQALYTVTCPPAMYPTNHKHCIQSHVHLPGIPPITSIVYSHMSTYQVSHQSQALYSVTIVARYWVFIYVSHYGHNDLFFLISSLRTQSKNYI